MRIMLPSVAVVFMLGFGPVGAYANSTGHFGGGFGGFRPSAPMPAIGPRVQFGGQPAHISTSPSAFSGLQPPTKANAVRCPPGGCGIFLNHASLPQNKYTGGIPKHEELQMPQQIPVPGVPQSQYQQGQYQQPAAQQPSYQQVQYQQPQDRYQGASICVTNYVISDTRIKCLTNVRPGAHCGCAAGRSYLEGIAQ